VLFYAETKSEHQSPGNCLQAAERVRVARLYFRLGGVLGGVQSRCPYAARCSDRRAYTAEQRVGWKEGQRETRAQETCWTYRSDSRAAKKSRCCWWFDSIQDTRSSTKRLNKERLGWRCAYAWECGAEQEEWATRCRRSWWSRYGALAVVSLSCSLSHTRSRELAGENATTFGIASSVQSVAISWSRRAAAA
jgi:hypothetical protein